MLKSYEAIYEKGRLKWLNEEPQVATARIIVTIIEEEKTFSFKRRTPPSFISGKAKIQGDIVSPIVDEEDWECLK